MSVKKKIVKKKVVKKVAKKVSKKTAKQLKREAWAKSLKVGSKVFVARMSATSKTVVWKSEMNPSYKRNQTVVSRSKDWPGHVLIKPRGCANGPHHGGTWLYNIADLEPA